MPDLDDRIRAVVNDLVDASPDPPAFESLAAHASRPPVPSTRWRLPAVVGAVVLVVVVVAVGVARQVEVGSRAPETLARTPGERGARASQFVTEWADGDSAAARVGFAPGLSADVDPLRMVAVWSEVTEAYGSLQSQAQPFETSSSSAGPFTDTVEATFQRGQLDISVEFDRSGQILTFGLTPVGKTSATIDLGAQARRVVTQLAAGDYEAVVASLDPLARVAVTASDVRTEWSNFEAAYGPFRGQGSPVVPGAGNLVDVPVTWARAAGYVQVNIDQTGQIASVFVLGPGAPADALGGRLVQANPAAAALAASAVDNLTHARFTEVRDDLGDLGSATLPVSRITQLWQGVVKPFGPLNHVGPAVPFQVTPTAIYYESGLDFAHGAAHIQLSVDTQNKIETLAVLPGPPSRLVGR